MTVLVVAAHPDDEVLGLGGTIARHADSGDAVHILLMADGQTARPGDATANATAIAERQRAAAAAADILGARPPRLFDFPDNRLDGVPLLDLAQVLESVISEVRPQIVYTHHPHDLNVDHRQVCQAVLTACRPLPDSTVRAIYSFETPSSTEWAEPAAHQAFVPRRYVDISATLPRKLDALRAYDSEMRPFPHARSFAAIEALAAWRGASAGLAAAEAFDILRLIERN